MRQIRKNVDYPYKPMTEKELLQKLDNSMKQANKGQYRNADDVISDMREKYGLL